jgi:acetylornithine/succinyldiaminopimelate/putrescine aminotransferase
LQPGDHGTTFGGSPVPCAAALEHLRLRDVLELEGHVAAIGAQLRAGLSALATEFPDAFAQPRGIGMMLGLPVRDGHAAKTFAEAALFEERLILNAAGDNTLRLVPPLVLSAEEAHDGLQRLRRACARALERTR